MKPTAVARRSAVTLLALAAATSGAEPAGPLVRRALDLGCREIVFAVRAMGRDGHWYANFGHHSRSYDNMQYGRDGGWLRKLDLRTGRAADLLADPGGGVRDPQVHYDAGKVLFSYRKAGSRYYHLHELDLDSGSGAPAGLRQLTDGPFDDLEPIYLPDGDLMFCSSRCNRFVQCWFTQVAILYRCRADGYGIQPVSCNIEQDNTPWMMPDGRVLYMRWEYVDRSRVRYHHLWTANPDGTAVMAYFGNMHPGTVMLDAKPIPAPAGSGRPANKVVSLFSPGHGRKEHAGRLAIINPDAGPDERRWVRTIGSHSDFRDPYPLAEDLFLVAVNDQLQLIDADGRTETVYRVNEPGMTAHEPRPLRPRKREPVIAPRVDPSQTTGRLILADVTIGRNMGGVRPGEIRKLLVFETLPKPVNFSGTMEPITHLGSFTLPRVLGTVPVEPDGSAYMEVPAMRSLFFVALDANDISVKRMQSFVSVMPGETTACTGCHENRTDVAPVRRDLLATQRPPSRIEPFDGVPGVFDFPRDIQPILDRHCARCHNYRKRPPRDLPLVGARGGMYSHSYYALMARGLVSHGRDADGNKAPRTIGTSASRLMKHIDGTHNQVRLTPREHTKVRLWIESGAPYPGTYAALGSGMVNPSVDGGVLIRRCAGCHKQVDRGKRQIRFRYDPELLYNLSEPDRSPLLLAPLAEDAGGWGLCKGTAPAAPPRVPQQPNAPAATVALPAVFASTRDGDYQALRKGIERSKEQLERVTRFDMPDFRPNEHYVREMKRYGFLPADADPARDRIDPYRTDEAYWRSFWHRPGG